MHFHAQWKTWKRNKSFWKKKKKKLAQTTWLGGRRVLGELSAPGPGLRPNPRWSAGLARLLSALSTEASAEPLRSIHLAPSPAPRRLPSRGEAAPGGGATWSRVKLFFENLGWSFKCLKYAHGNSKLITLSTFETFMPSSLDPAYWLCGTAHSSVSINCSNDFNFQAKSGSARPASCPSGWRDPFAAPPGEEAAPCTPDPHPGEPFVMVR